MVNRRTVVDQSTHEAENMREALNKDIRLKGVKDALQSLGALDWNNPLAISTLRGEMADNGEWRDDPARPAESWSTVTPVILPGYDDPAHYRKRLSQEIGADEQKQLLARLDHRIDCLIRKAVVQAGFSKSLADNAVIEWRKAGFWAGTESADRYRVPKHLNHFSRYHVRLRWRDENKRPLRVSGPICIGGGRFYGLGLFARFGDQLL